MERLAKLFIVVCNFYCVVSTYDSPFTVLLTYPYSSSTRTSYLRPIWVNGGPCELEDYHCMNFEALKYTNGIRKRAGVPGIIIGTEAMLKNAMHHSHEMLQAEKIYHQALNETRLGCESIFLSENVAQTHVHVAKTDAPTNPALLCVKRLENSAMHYRNMVNIQFEEGVMGILVHRGYVWCTQIFARETKFNMKNPMCKQALGGTSALKLHMALDNEPCKLHDIQCMNIRATRYTNRIRIQVGKNALNLGTEAMLQNALDHSNRMQRRDNLFHQNIATTNLGCKSVFLSENVAKNNLKIAPNSQSADSAWICIEQFRNNPFHYKNMIASHVSETVTGVFVFGGQIWCTQLFTVKTKFGSGHCKQTGNSDNVSIKTNPIPSTSATPSSTIPVSENQESTNTIMNNQDGRPCLLTDVYCMNSNARKYTNQIRNIARRRELGFGTEAMLRNAIAHSKHMERKNELFHQYLATTNLGCESFFAGENLAKNSLEVAKHNSSVDPAWMCIEQFRNSPSHYNNMVANNVTETVMGVYVLDENIWCTQLFTVNTKFSSEGECKRTGPPNIEERQTEIISNMFQPTSSWKNGGPCGMSDAHCMNTQALKYTNKLRRVYKIYEYEKGTESMLLNALEHSKTMQKKNELFHQELKELDVGCNTTILSENVSQSHVLFGPKYAPSDPSQICVDQFHNSAEHNKNLHSSKFEQMVMGVFVHNGYIWCTQLFSVNTSYGQGQCDPAHKTDDSSNRRQGSYVQPFTPLFSSASMMPFKSPSIHVHTVSPTVTPSSSTFPSYVTLLSPASSTHAGCQSRSITQIPSTVTPSNFASRVS